MRLVKHLAVILVAAGLVACGGPPSASAARDMIKDKMVASAKDDFAWRKLPADFLTIEDVVVSRTELAADGRQLVAYVTIRSRFNHDLSEFGARAEHLRRRFGDFKKGDVIVSAEYPKTFRQGEDGWALDS